MKNLVEKIKQTTLKQRAITGGAVALILCLAVGLTVQHRRTYLANEKAQDKQMQVQKEKQELLAKHLKSDKLAQEKKANAEKAKKLEADKQAQAKAKAEQVKKDAEAKKDEADKAEVTKQAQATAQADTTVNSEVQATQAQTVDNDGTVTNTGATSNGGSTNNVAPTPQPTPAPTPQPTPDPAPQPTPPPAGVYTAWVKNKEGVVVWTQGGFSTLDAAATVAIAWLNANATSGGWSWGA